MAALNDNLVAWTYTTGGATPRTFRLRAKKEITDQVTGGAAVKVGGSAAASTVSLPIKGFRPRRAYVSDQATGLIKRSVVCYSATAPILTAGETIILQHAGADTTFVSSGGSLGEKLPAGITQSS